MESNTTSLFQKLDLRFGEAIAVANKNAENEFKDAVNKIEERLYQTLSMTNKFYVYLSPITADLLIGRIVNRNRLPNDDKVYHFDIPEDLPREIRKIYFDKLEASIKEFFQIQGFKIGTAFEFVVPMMK